MDVWETSEFDKLEAKIHQENVMKMRLKSLLGT